MSKRLSAADWAAIVTLYERGDKNTRELAEQYQVSRQAIEAGLKDRGIQKNSRLNEVKAETEDAARAEHARRIAEANRYRSQYVQYVDIINKRTIKKLVDAENNANLPSINADLVVLGNAMKIIAKGREEIWTILDIKELANGEDELPDLNIGEYTPEEIAAVQESQEESYQATQDLDED